MRSSRGLRGDSASLAKIFGITKKVVRKIWSNRTQAHEECIQPRNTRVQQPIESETDNDNAALLNFQGTINNESISVSLSNAGDFFHDNQ